MWRFIEEGPLLKFPLRESPFMAADPMYRDVVIAPPIRFQRITNTQANDFHPSFLSTASSLSTKSSKSRMTISEQQSSSTMAIPPSDEVSTQKSGPQSIPSPSGAASSHSSGLA